MNSRLRYIRVMGMLLMMWSLILACSPNNNTAVPAWYCPTPTPLPTKIKESIARPTATPRGPVVTDDIYYQPYEEEYGRDSATGSVRTPTPYTRGGVNEHFFLNQRIIVGPLVVRVLNYEQRPSPEADQQYHVFDLQVENRSSEAVRQDFDWETSIRVIERPDGQRIGGNWAATGEALRAVGKPQNDGVFPPGSTVDFSLAIPAPVGTAQSIGMNFAQSQPGQTRDGQSAGNMVWVTTKSDPNCSHEGVDTGDAPSGPNVPPPVIGDRALPVPPGTYVSRGYGCHPYFTGTQDGCGNWWWHDGIDWAAPTGTRIYAAVDMDILYAGPDIHSHLDCSGIQGSKPPHNGFGNYIRGRDAQGAIYDHGHVSAWYASTGQHVKVGTVIGLMGSTGCSTGSHLHFRVKVGGHDVNPWPFVGGQQ